MKSGFRKWSVRLVVAVIGLAVVGWVFRDFLIRQIQIYYLGTIEVRRTELNWRLNDTEAVEVLSLADPFEKYPDPPAETALGYRVHAKATFSKDDTVKVLKLWHRLMDRTGPSAMCHSPGYVLRFRTGSQLLFETSVCWMCSNYSLPLGLFGRTTIGFDAESAEGKELLELLKTRVPRPASSETTHDDDSLKDPATAPR